MLTGALILDVMSLYSIVLFSPPGTVAAEGVKVNIIECYSAEVLVLLNVKLPIPNINAPEKWL